MRQHHKNLCSTSKRWQIVAGGRVRVDLRNASEPNPHPEGGARSPGSAGSGTHRCALGIRPAVAYRHAMLADSKRPALDWSYVYSNPITRLLGTSHGSYGSFGIELEGGLVLHLHHDGSPFPVNSTTGVPHAYPYGTFDDEEAVPPSMYVGKRLKNFIYSVPESSDKGCLYYAVLEYGDFLTLGLVDFIDVGFHFGTRDSWKRNEQFFNAWDHTELCPASLYG